MEEYLKENQINANVISAPRLLDWTREKFNKDSNYTFPVPSTEDIAEKLRKFIESIQDEKGYHD